MEGQMSTFTELAAVLALAALMGIVSLLLRQPLIVAFIATGLVAGPDLLGLLDTADPIFVLAEIGIAVLLFLVGLKLDLHIVKSLGPVAVATGLGQVAFTSIIGFVICLALGFEPMAATYIAVALTFSSTIIIVKLLSDKREVDSLHGRIAIGFLIVQDLVVVLAMVGLSTLGAATGKAGPEGGLARTLAGSLAGTVAVALFMRYAAEPLLRRVARVPELLVTFALAWAVLFAALADTIGLGKELGGLAAGVSLASTPYREAIASRLGSLRDFLLLFFFLALGAGMSTATLGEQVPAALVLSAFVLVGNPLIVLAIMGFMGYRKRTGFLAGLTVAQISEFSLIFVAAGIAVGHVEPATLSIVTLVGLATITLSTYMILYSERLYAACERFLGAFERAITHREAAADDEASADTGYDVLLFGLGRYGMELGRALRDQGLRTIGVDFDPETLRAWHAAGLAGMYGDAADPEFAGSLPLAGACWAVITIPAVPASLTHDDARRVLLARLRESGFAGRIAVRADSTAEAEQLRAAGADLILEPFSDAATRAVEENAPEQHRPQPPR
jgi:Kef-type K+ transport system membrane component KefB